jgi:hypothetical protein
MTEQTAAPRKPRRLARKPQAEGIGPPAITANLVAVKPRTKASLVEGLLQQANGASLDDLCQATGWQPHTCRAFLTGVRKKGRGLEKAKREDGVTIYHMAPIQAAA